MGITRKPSYGDAVLWLAANDETAMHDANEIDGLTTVLLAADLFGVDPHRLAVDIVRARHGAGRWQLSEENLCRCLTLNVIEAIDPQAKAVSSVRSHTLPTHAVGDAQGISTYPRLLLRIGGANLLHIAGRGLYDGPLCGTQSGGRPLNLVEYLGDRSHQVCRKCRVAAMETAK
jgi:hypothetical protein